MFDLLNGPLNKSIYTQHLELVAKYLLYSEESVAVHVQNNSEGKKELHVNLGGVDVNLSLLFSKADFAHLQISQKDSVHYLHRSISPLVKYLCGVSVNNHVQDDAKLTQAERSAIRAYTGAAYLKINKCYIITLKIILNTSISYSIKSLAEHSRALL